MAKRAKRKPVQKRPSGPFSASRLPDREGLYHVRKTGQNEPVYSSRIPEAANSEARRLNKWFAAMPGGPISRLKK